MSGGLADAWVSVGHTGAAVAAAVLGLGRVAGMSRPALAVVVPALAGPVVLVDAGAAPDATPDVLRQFALAGWAYARALGVADPAVGLLTIGSEEGKGDRLRKSTHDLLAETLPGVRRRATSAPSRATTSPSASGRRSSSPTASPATCCSRASRAPCAGRPTASGPPTATPSPRAPSSARRPPRDFAGGMLLGVNGVTVIGHGAGTAEEICACVRLADRAARMGLVPATQAALATVVRAMTDGDRRLAAGIVEDALGRGVRPGRRRAAPRGLAAERAGHDRRRRRVRRATPSARRADAAGLACASTTPTSPVPSRSPTSSPRSRLGRSAERKEPA